MKSISKYYYYDERYFSSRIPVEAQYLPDPRHDLPVFIKEEFIAPAVCDEMVERFLAVGSFSASSVDFGIRKCEQYDLVDENKSIYENAFSMVKSEIEKFFGADILGSAGAHGLGYYPGGQYGVHSDNCDPILDDEGKVIRFKYTDPSRQISLIFFLSDSVMKITARNQAIGGNLSFPFLRDDNGEVLLIEPKRGLLVSFPSNSVFGHEVHEVVDGYRMTIVDWFTANFI